MVVKVLSEHGIEPALLGLGLSYGKTSDCSADEFSRYVESNVRDRMMHRARTLSGKGGGHDKFLRMLVVYLDITAPLFWWKEFDTYTVGVVKQSESTMHTLMDKPLTPKMFEEGSAVMNLAGLNTFREQEDFFSLNANLPQSFLQRRIVMLNYAVLQNIFQQRKGHKLHQWRTFINNVKAHCRYPELLCPGM